MFAREHRRILPFLALAVLVTVVGVVDAAPAHAQETLVLSDFDQTGLDAELLALVTAGETGLWYARGRFGDTGTLVDGELGIGPDNNSLIRIRETDNGGNLLINHDSSSVLGFSSYFGAGGAGRDLTLHFQLSATEVYSVPVADSLGVAGGGYANFNLRSTGGQVALEGVDPGDRFIIAFTRPGNIAPEFSSDTATRSIDENSSPATDVGAAVTATDADSDPLTYSLTATSATGPSTGSFASLFSIVADTGQIQVASGASVNYEQITSVTVTVTAEDAEDSDTISVTISINDLDDAPQLTPDPSTLAPVPDTNQQFTVSLPANGHPAENVTVTVTQGTGEMKLATAEAGLTCDTTTTELTVAATGSFYARFCERGTATIGLAPSGSALDVRSYAVTIPTTAPAMPTGLTATAGPQAGEMTLTWTAPDDGGSQIRRYEYALFYTGYEDTGTWTSTESTSASHVVEGLTHYGLEHQFWVRAVNDIGTGMSSAPATGTPGGLPGAPTGLSATGAEDQVSLSWTAGAANGGTLSRYEYSSDDGTTWRTTGGTATEYDVTQTSAATPVNLVAGTSYTFRVRAVNEYGNSPASASQAATPTTHPAEITNLTATHGDATVTLKWTAPSIGGTAITSYDYSTDDGGTWRTTGSTGTEYGVTQTSAASPVNLVNGTEYTFKVRARNKVGAGGASNSVSATPRTTPGAPTGLGATPKNAQVDLAWTAPGDGGASISDYEYSTDGGTNWASTGSAAASYEVTQTSAASPVNLVNGTEYQFAVRAVNSEGSGRASSVVNATPREAAVAPEQVTGLTAVAGDAQVALSWTAPSNGGSAITRYEYSADDGATWRMTGGTATEYDVTQTSAATPVNLANGTSYTFRVRAVNDIGAGPQSASVSATPRPPSAPSAPTGVRATSGRGQVALSWTAPSVEHDETITDYHYSSDNGTTWRSTGSTATSYTATQTSAATPANLTLGTSYTFRVRAVNDAGNGAQSASATATPYGVPGAPSNLQGSPGNRAVTLNWTAAAANGRSITRYEYSSDDGATWRTTGSTATEYIVDQTSAASPADLVNDTSYTFRVRAVNSVGSGPRSGSVTVAPTSNTVPSQVTGLTVRPGDGFVVLGWAVAFNGGSSLTRYEYSSDDGATWRTTGGTSLTYKVTQTSAASPANLLNGTTYTFKVRACNVLGCGEASSGASSVPNNQPPSFSGNTASRRVNENAPVGTNVGAAVTASDPESDSISYSLTGPNPAGFTVTSSGRIQTGQVLDHEATGRYTVTLQAQATGGSDSIAVTINVDDVNEAPAFSSSAASRSVAENSAADTSVGGPVTAADPDGDTLGYSLLNGGGRFTILSVTGQIQVAAGAVLDYEGVNRYTVTVRATDPGNLQASIDVTITLTNVVEAAFLSDITVPPETVTRATATVTARLSNSEGASATVYFRYRTPPEVGAWTLLGSETTSGTSVSVDLTGIAPNTGYRVQASLDNAFPSSGRRQVEFTTAVNAAPVFASQTMTRQVVENSPAGTAVGGAVTATDSDGDILVYSLGGTDAASFEVDSSSGQITVALGTDLDYETTRSYAVVITAADPYRAAATVTVTVEVLDVREAGLLGRVVLRVGSSADDYGYAAGRYGNLVSGSFPGALFGDGSERTIDEMYEDGDAHWYFTYAGGAANDWRAEQEAIDEILVQVAYRDGLDTRSFVWGGFVDSRLGDRGLRLDPPLPSRDWNSRGGQEITFEFRRLRSQAVAVVPPRLTDPPGTPGSFVRFLAESTPGGPDVAQMLIVVLVFLGFVHTVRPTPHGIVMSAIVLIMTPWLPVLFGFGSTMAGVIVLVNMLAGGFSYKAFFARTES